MSGEKIAPAKQEKYENIKEDLNQEEDSKGLLYTDPSHRPKLKANNSRTVINKYS